MEQVQTINAEDVLSDVRLFGGLDRRQLSKLARTAHLRSYAPGDIIVREGDDGIGLFLIGSGQVEVFQCRDGEERPLRRMHAGEVFGQLALLAGHPRTATVRAIEPTECLVFTAWNFRAMVDESPQIAVQLAITLARWLVDV